MAFIYLDESGDLGFDLSKPKTSRYFIISCLFCTQKRPVEKIVKRLMRSFSANERARHDGVLHAYKETDRTRRRLLNELAKLDVSIITVYLDKRKVYTQPNDEERILYNHVANILLDKIYTRSLVPLDEPIILIASRRDTNKFLNREFESYLSQQVSQNHKAHIAVATKTPAQEKGLQVVDCVSWAIFRGMEHGDDSYRTILKRIIVEESPLFP